MPTNDAMLARGAKTIASAMAAARPSRRSRAFDGEIAPRPPAAATISGEGVSPAASAAASGSPPGNAAATCATDDGRCAGSFSRHLRITRSTAGSNPGATFDGAVGASSVCFLLRSSRLAASNAFLPVDSS